MPSSGHKHVFKPLVWTTQETLDWRNKPYVGVIFSCQSGICAQTKSYRITKRSRAVPEGITPSQFEAMRRGEHWPEAQLAQSTP